MAEDWERLRRAVRAERARREWSQSRMAFVIGFSVSTLRKIERGRWRSQDPYDVLAQLDRGLRWTPRSAEYVLFDSKDPVPLPEPPDPDPELDRILMAWPRVPAAVRRALAAGAEADLPP